MTEQAPKNAEHGRFLQPDSVGGRKVDFVNDSTVATATLTLQAAGDGTNRDFGRFESSFDYIQDGNIYPWQSIVAWPYITFYIDGTGSGLGFETGIYRQGSLVDGTSAANRKTMNIDIYTNGQYYLPQVGTIDNSAFIIYYCRNYDSTLHLLGCWTSWKYILIGDSNG